MAVLLADRICNVGTLDCGCLNLGIVGIPDDHVVVTGCSSGRVSESTGVRDVPVCVGCIREVSSILSGILDIEDYIVSNILLPGGSLIMVLFCTSEKFGWGFKNFTEEANTGNGLKVKKWMRAYMKFVLPALMFIFWAICLITPFVDFI